MQVDEYVERLRVQFAAIAEVAGTEVREVAERLVTPLESAVRLVLLEALAAAADEITLDLSPGSVHLRLREQDADFVVTPAPAGPGPDVPAAPREAAPEADGGPVARVNFRPSESLKARIEDAAGREGLSVNTWLSRAATAALDRPGSTTPAAGPPPGARRGGWFG
ncbi:hypothetical protein [Actinomycetospora atypica]|uniref:Histidine kinase n=1 Tax=Actinomycetospora atypica TaxID=1290095 RepID=A0ABV9YTI6_9PSEU